MGSGVIKKKEGYIQGVLSRDLSNEQKIILLEKARIYDLRQGGCSGCRKRARLEQKLINQMINYEIERLKNNN